MTLGNLTTRRYAQLAAGLVVAGFAIFTIPQWLSDLSGPALRAATLAATGFVSEQTGEGGSIGSSGDGKGTLDSADSSIPDFPDAELAATIVEINPPMESSTVTAVEEAVLEGAERTAALEMQLTLEPIDAEWSAQHERTLSDVVFRGDLAGVTVHSVVCRSSFCRMDLHAQTEEALESLVVRLLDLAEQASGTAELLGVEELGNGLAAKIYISRDGFELPVM